MAKENSLNLDPITSAPGAYALDSGVGAVAGGLGGKAIAESVNPTAEETYWRENYIRESYYEAGRPFDDYAPAYRLGLYGLTQYEGSFDETESRLAADWDIKKETSTLSWPQARSASRAAWERISRQRAMLTPACRETTVEPVADDDEVIDTLNDLLESCRDGEYGFTASAEHAKSSDIKTLLLRRAGECRDAGLELQTLIRQLGGEADAGGSISGALHRGWVSVRGTLSGHSDKSMLDECERGEDAAVARYRKALKQNLPSSIRTVLERQAQGARRNHDQVRALRDAMKTTA